MGNGKWEKSRAIALASLRQSACGHAERWTSNSTATGETLAQVQDRVLGVGVNSSSLYTAIPGYGTGGIRAGWRGGRHHEMVDVENLNVKNYRGISWGIDAPGWGITVKYSTTF